MEDLIQKAREFNENLNNNFPAIKKWLNDRKLPDDIINHHEIGVADINGKNWVSIPVKDVFGEVLFFKLRRFPNDTETPNKYLFYPGGSDATIYGWNILLEENEMVVVCEGEFDSLVLRAYGIPAVTSTAGSSCFKKDWIVAFKDVKKVYTVFDNDEPGESGAKRVGQLILEDYPNKEVYNIKLPDIVGEHGDITDYFLKDGDLDKLFNEYSYKVYAEKKPLPTRRVYTNQDMGDGLLSQEDIERAKQTNCSEFVDIVRKDYDGKQWARCPFGHEDRTPSFCCYPSGGGYSAYCCGKAGDTIDLVMQLYKLSFTDAVRYIIKK